MTGDDQAALRYAVAFNMGTVDPVFNRNAAYAGPHLLVMASGIQNMSSPGSPTAVAVEELRRLDVPMDPSGLATSLERSIEGLRDTFWDLLAGDPGWDGTGVMLTAMLWRGTHAAIAHVGNTRAYMLRGGELTQLTRDHTLGQLLVEEGTIGPDEMGSDPQHASVVVRWLEGKPGEPADIIAHEAAVGDRYVLCTARTDHTMTPGALRDIVQDTARDPQDVADEIAGMPLERYGTFACVVADVVRQPG